MSNTSQTELRDFYNFLAEQLKEGETDLSPEDALLLYRTKNPTGSDLTQNVAAIKNVLADVEEGEPGREALEVLNKLRRKHNLSHETKKSS